LGLRLGNIIARRGWRGKPKNTSVAERWVGEATEKLLRIGN
jgi:hypothetical protein